MISPSRLALGLCLALFVTLPALAVENFDAAAMTRAREAITANKLKSHVDTLASDTFEGREGGSRGGRAAAGYLVKELEQLEVKPAGTKGGYAQDFDGNQRNILGVIEGSDPELADEFIVIGAHYDHVGYGTRDNSFGPIGQIHNGADDNASGTAALIEFTRALKMLPAPRRSILIAFWDGEEKGLLGSKHWVNNPTVPLKQVKLMINLDMVGRLRDNQLEVYGTRSGWGLRQLVSRVNDDPELRLAFPWHLEENSDHHSFWSRDIPVLMLHTGLHDDYHRPSDDSHLINNDGMQTVTRYMLPLAVELANADRLTAFRAESRREGRGEKAQHEMPLPAAPPRFGIRWDADADQSEGVAVVSVTNDTPAAAAGIKPLDRITTFGGEAITDGDRLRNLVSSATGNVEIAVMRPGQEEPLALTLEFPETPVRLGVSWRDDPADTGALTVVRLIAGSPAARAGMRLGDRILQLGGQPFENGEAFRQRVQETEGPLELLIERQGKFQTVTVE